MIGGRWVVCLSLVASLSACGGNDDAPEVAPTTTAPITTAPTTAVPEPAPTTSAPDLAVHCSGSGDTTVVLMAGMNTPGDVFSSLAGELSATSQVCYYDRAGIGSSPALAADAPDPTPGRAAADLHAALAAQDIGAPYVVLGWSYGGLVAQAFTSAYPEDVTGLVLEDTSFLAQFTDPEAIADNEAAGIVWAEGGRDIDQPTLIDELSDLRLDVPAVVLSQDTDEQWGPALYAAHDELALLSDDSVRVIGIGSGHEMHVDVPGLVAAAVTTVVSAAEGGPAVAPCDDRYTAVGGRCRDL